MAISGEGTIGLLFKIVADGSDVPKTMKAIETAIGNNLNLLKKLFSSVEDAANKARATIEREYAKIQSVAQRAERERARFANQAAKEIADSLNATTRKWAEEAAKQAKISAQLAKEHVANQKKSLDALSTAGQGLRNAGIALSAILTAPLILSGKAAVEAATKYESARLKLESVTGSAKEAARQFEILGKLAKLPAVDLASAISDAAKLQASGVSFQRSEALIRNVSNLAARGGGTAEDTSEVLRQLSQAVGTNKLNQQDFRVILERIPELGKLLRQELGSSVAKELRESGVTVEKLIQTLEGLTPEKVGIAKLNYAERFANIRQDIERALVPLGEVVVKAILPALERLTPLIVQLSEKFAALSPFVQNLIIGFTAIAAVLGPALIVLGALASSVSSIIGFFGLFAPAAASVAGGATALSAAWAGVVSVVGAIAAPVGIAIAAIVTLYAAWKTNFGGIREFTAQVVDFVQERWTAFMQWWREIFPLLKEIAEPILKALGALFVFYSNNIKAVWQAIWPPIAEAIRFWWTLIGGTIKAALLLITGHWRDFQAEMQGLNEKLWERLKNIVALGINGIVELISNLFTRLLRLIGVADSTGNSLGTAIGVGILAGIRAQAPLIYDIIEKITTFARNRIDGIKQEAARAKERSNFDEFKDADKDFITNADFAANREATGAKPPPGSGGSSGAKGKGGGGGRKDISEIQQSIQLLEVEEKAIKRRYEAEIKEVKAAFDAKETDYQTYAEIVIAAENKMFAARMAVLKKEEQETRNSDLLPRQKAVKVAQILEDQAQAVAAHNAKLQELADEKRRNDEKGLNEYLELLRRKEEAEDEYLKDLIEKRRGQLQAEQEFNSRIRGLISERKQIEADLLRSSADQLERAGGSPAIVLERRSRADAADENARSQRVLQSIQDDKDANFQRNQAYQQYIETLKQLDLLEEAERRRHAAAMADIGRELQIATEQANPLSTRSIFGDEYADKLEETGSRWQAFGTVFTSTAKAISNSGLSLGNLLAQVMAGITKGLLSAVSAWILYGRTGPAVLRQVAASAIAAAAQQALVEAVVQAAKGFAALAEHRYSDAALHFKSAAFWGTVGAVSALAGRAIAGDSLSGAEGSAGSQSAAGAALTPPPYAVARDSRQARDAAVIEQLNQQHEFSKIGYDRLNVAAENLNAATSRLTAMPAGHVVGIGLQQNPQAAGVAVIQTANTDSGFGTELGRRLNLR